MLSKELLNSEIFSLLDNIFAEIIIIITATNGIDVIADIFPNTENKYTIKNNIDLIKSVFLKTAIIESECFNKFIKLILDGPKYLMPLVDFTEHLNFVTLVNEPEKLLQVAFSEINL